MADAFLWWLALEILGLAALPLSVWLFSRTATRGYAMSKTLGLLLAGWASSTLASVGVPFGATLIVGCLIGLASVSAWVFYRQPRVFNSLLHSTSFLRSVAATELLFATAFALW